MTMVLLPSGDYLNLEHITRVRVQDDGRICAYFGDSCHWYDGNNAKAILAALDAMRLRVANHKRA
jgi:hypothetical protein